MKNKDYLLVVIIFFLTGCYADKSRLSQTPKNSKGALFELLSAKTTGINFSNKMIYTGPHNFSSETRQWFGGGVSVGDINNDGLIDILLTANQQESKLYLNLGAFRFKEITESAGIDTKGGWTTGAVMADVNGDGYNDIYICRGGMQPNDKTANLLFINNKNLTFREEAEAYGVNDVGLTTSASFFDYDNDGDLDLYTLNYPITNGDDEPLNFSFYETTPADSVISDKLFENIGGRFINVSHNANIPIEKGSGLGLVVSDINQDGWPDIYVGNDWMENDYIYINQKNKTFKNEEANLFSKNSFFSMGCDIADMNNDCLPDILTLDMAPAQHARIKTHDTQQPIDYYFMQQEYGKLLQYTRNMLQVNKGNGQFAEQGEMTGIARTDWGWSALWADFTNDGWKDLFTTKGMGRDIGYRDYVNLMITEGDKPEYKHIEGSYFANMPRYFLSNYIFENKNGEKFTPQMKAWGVDQLVNSQGAAYADLDNDGDIDLIVNNIDTIAFIYRNVASPQKNNYLRVSVKGKSLNTNGFGTKAWLYANGKKQYAELTNARGFQSSSEDVLHFGLGADSIVDSLVVVFPSFTYTTLVNVKANQHLILTESDAHERQYMYSMHPAPIQMLRPIGSNIMPAFVHRENDFNDFKRDKLIPRMFSKEGPALATGDLNGDELEDFYIGGAAGKSGALYIQKANGTFISKHQVDIAADSAYEDVAALIADFNGDKKNDLYVVSGSNEFVENSPQYQDRIYLNTGNGLLKRCEDCLPVMLTSKSCITPYDYDDDGKIDLFIGGRTVPQAFGKIPQSYLLHNIGNGKYTDVTASIAPSLQYIGMITDAEWVDVDRDNKAELIVTGDWMSPTILKFNNGKLENNTSPELRKSTGWWNSISTGDFNNDGLVDFACGNWGLNTFWKATDKEPLTLLVNDFDNNGTIDPIICCYLEGENGTFAGRDIFCKTMPKFFNKFHTYKSFAECKIENIFPKEAYEKSEKLRTVEMQTCLFINKGNGVFKKMPLPYECQTSPVSQIVVHDFDVDGKPDLLLLGNTNQNFYEHGNIDAFRGVLLKGNDNGSFSVIPYKDCGINIQKFVRQCAIVKGRKSPVLLVACNNDSLLMYSLKH